MRFTVVDERGGPIEFECPDTIASRWTCGAILEGKTYPDLPFITDVKTIVDVGANCGATTVHLARLHPEARVHALEPGSEARSYLKRNVSGLTNVTVHPFGLHSQDQSLLLYVDEGDIGQATVIQPAAPTGRTETVELRAAGGWAAQEGIGAIDILKVDVEGCEVDVLESLAGLLPEVKVLYVEYDSRQNRKRIAELVEPTHELYFATMMALDQGEGLYVRGDLADQPGATDRLREIFALSFGG